LSLGEDAVALPRTTSYREWIERLVDYSRSPEVEAEMNYWLAQPWERIMPLPRDVLDGYNTEESLRSIVVSLSVEDTDALLKETSGEADTRINEMLLAALVRTLARWSGNPTQMITVTGHGRQAIVDEVDLSRTAGWFNTLYSAIFDIEGAASPEDALAEVKTKLRAVPNEGQGLNLLRCLNGDAEIVRQLKPLPRADIIFNYRGRAENYERSIPSASSIRIVPTMKFPGAIESPLNQRPCLLWWTGQIEEDKLYVYFAYSKNIHHHETIARLAGDYLSELQALIGGEQDRLV
jgi:non-ribosomal peptide synthase protein (TIGR01720 family)